MYQMRSLAIFAIMYFPFRDRLGRTSFVCFNTLGGTSDIENCSIFSVGTAGIILQAPTLYDTRTAIDTQLSAISYATIKPPEV